MKDIFKINFVLFTGCYTMDFVFPQNSCLEILTPNVMVLGGKSFGRWLDNEGKPSWMGLVAL